MRVTYHWTEADWNEAVAMATEKPRRRGNVPAMVYALVGIPLIGAVMDGVRSVRGTGKLSGAGMTVPALLMLLAAVLGAVLFVAHQQRRKRVLSRMPMPEGQWEAVLQEAGWSFHPRLDGPDSPTVPGSANVTAEAVAGCTVEKTLSSDAPAPAAPVVANKPEQPEELNAVVLSVATVPAVFAAGVIQDEVLAVAVEKVIPAETAVPKSEAESNEATGRKPEHAAESATLLPPLPPALAGASITTPIKKETVLQPWSELTASRTGDRAIIFLLRTGFYALPLCSLTPDQASHLHRMVIRKLRPAPNATAIRRRR